MQVVIWIFSVLGVIGIGIGLGNLIYYLFWQRYAITREESVARSEFEKFKAALEAIEAKLQEGFIKPSELEALSSAIESEVAKRREESVARSEFEKFKAALEAIEAKLQEEYITQSQFDRFREAIKEIM